MDKFIFLPKKKINRLPKTPGVYAFEDAKNLIYIGKAANIKERAKNHFQQPSYKDYLFADNVKKVGYIKTDSEIEALILEATLIKKFQPKFNIAWRDDKNYFWVAIAQNQQKIPYVYITHQLKNYKNKNLKIRHIGPFTEGRSLKRALKFLRKIFPYYTNVKHPKTKCAYCHIDLCPGIKPNLKQYKKNIKKLILILQGNRSRVLSSFKKEMRNFSEQKNYEQAAKLRDKIYNLQQIMAHAHVIENSKFDLTGRIECYDVSNIQGKFATGSMVSAQGGPASGWVFDKSQYKKFKIKFTNKPNDIAMLKEVLIRRFRHPEWGWPDAILIDGGKAQLNVAIEARNETLHYNQRSRIRMYSIAKGRQELFIENRSTPIPLKNLSKEIRNLILRLDSEAHRFALAYHKKLRKKNLFI